MSNLIASKKLANEYLQIALDNNEFEEFLVGDPLYELTVKDPYGNDVFSSMHVMEAIYDKHRKDPNFRIDNLTFETILKVLKESQYSNDILNVFGNIEYQINAQKNGTSAFSIDCIKILEKIKDNINRNKLSYKTPEDLQHPNGIWEELEKHNVTIEQLTGHKIL